LFDQPPADDPHLPGSIARVSEQPRIEAARKWFHENLQALQDKMKAAGQGPPDTSAPTLRLDLFLPYLLVRSFPNDLGGRPFPSNRPMQQSPDIWLAAGDPATAPPVPDKPLASLIALNPYTIYAHVWNLGRAPIVGVRVEFYFTPAYTADGPPPGFSSVPIGVARVDLPPRTSPQCHTLVRCPVVLKPYMPHQLGAFLEVPELTVRVSAVGDPIGQNQWHPTLNRHVARRVIPVGIGAP
jgi:hypothetical protein